MRNIKTYKMFESLYTDEEYIDTGVLLDILQDITIEEDIPVYINKLLSYGDYRDIPKTSIGDGYIRRSKDQKQSFGVYDVKFVLPNSNRKFGDIGYLKNPLAGPDSYTDRMYWKKIEKLCRDAARYYNGQSDNSICAFINRDSVIDTDETDSGKITHIRVYFSRVEILKYALTKFHQQFDLI